MKFLRTYFILLLTIPYVGVGTPSQLPTLNLKTVVGSEELRLYFPSGVPGYIKFCSQEKPQCLIRWDHTVDETFSNQLVLTPSTNSMTKAFLKLSPSLKKGYLLIDHKANTTPFVLTQPNANELVFRSSLKTSTTPQKEIPKKPVPLQTQVPMENKITLNLKRAPTSKILRTIAAESGRSIVFGEEVEGSVSVNLKDASYEEAIETILKATPYRAEHSGKATVVRSLANYKAFKTFQMVHVDVNRILTLVKDIAKEAQVTVDPYTNSLFVADTVEKLAQIEQMLITLDKEPQQVEVEAAIVQVGKKDTSDVGWDLTAQILHKEASNDFNLKRISPLDSTSAEAKGFFVGLSWQSVRAILSLLETNTKTKVLARPKLLALNDEKASILIGSKIGYKVLQAQGQGLGTLEEVKFLEVGTQLKFTPHITHTGDILLSINPKVSDGSIDPKTSAPTENTTTAETKILAKNGQTIIIGGLLRERIEKTVNRVPILGDIPVLGFLFRGTTESHFQDEIMILLTPRVLTPQRISTHTQQGNQFIQDHFGHSLSSEGLIKGEDSKP